MTRCTFLNVSAAGNGGGIHAFGRNVNIVVASSKFERCAAKKNGGSISVDGNGALLSVSRSNFTDGTAISGGGLFMNPTSECPRCHQLS